MDFLHFVYTTFFKVDSHLEMLCNHYGIWVYAILFLIIFCETGLVITPFLPGDALLFTVGTLAARDYFSIELCIGLLTVAAFLGNTLNYGLGRKLGAPLFKEDALILKKKYLENAEAFFAKHGGIAVVLSRFLPILRTLVPFVAGMGRMPYIRFLSFNALGAGGWVLSMTLTGWFFGNIPFIKKNFEVAVIGIIVLSLLPIFWESFCRWRKAHQLVIQGSPKKSPIRPSVSEISER